MTTFKDMRQAKVIEEEQRLEELVFGSGQDDEVLGDNIDTTPDESLNVEADLTSQSDPFETAREDTVEKSSSASEAELASLRKELADERHRFGKYKGSTDKTIFEQRQQIAYLSEQVASLRKTVSEFKESKETSPVSDIPEDVVDILGEDTVAFINKQNESLREELKQLRKERDEDSIRQAEKTREDQLAQNDQLFREGLQRLVPDYEQMNVDPKFIDWLSAEDQYGMVRIDTMRADQARGDYIRVAQFFNEYKEIMANRQPELRPVEDSIDSHIGPTGAKGNSSVDNIVGDKKGTIKMSEINAFNADVAKGKYKYELAKAEAMEAKIFKAMQEGKIIFDVDPK